MKIGSTDLSGEWCYVYKQTLFCCLNNFLSDGYYAKVAVKGQRLTSFSLIWRHLMLHKQLVEQTMENAAVRFAVMDIAIKTGSRIDFGWREEHSIMVDSVLFLIYGVTWCVGVTMPIVIFCIYRTFLRWGWVLFMEKIPRLKRILFPITSKEYLLIGPRKITNYFFRGYSLADSGEEGDQMVAV